MSLEQAVVLIIPRRLLSHLEDAARAAYPEECCGLLVGLREGEGEVRVTRAVASANMALSSRRDRFEIDPLLRIALAREVRGTPEDIVGHYHSHPDGQAVPSALDRERAWEPGLRWLIIAPGGIAAFRHDSSTNRLQPISLLVEED